MSGHLSARYDLTPPGHWRTATDAVAHQVRPEHLVHHGTDLVYGIAAIPLVIAVIVAIVVWRSAAKERVGRELAINLANPDPMGRRAALDALTDDVLARNARILFDLLEREQDLDVLDALAAAVARSRWEPTDDGALIQLRKWVAGGHSRTTASSRSDVFDEQLSAPVGSITRAAVEGEATTSVSSDDAVAANGRAVLIAVDPETPAPEVALPVGVVEAQDDAGDTPPAGADALLAPIELDVQEDIFAPARKAKVTWPTVTEQADRVVAVGDEADVVNPEQVPVVETDEFDEDESDEFENDGDESDPERAVAEHRSVKDPMVEPDDDEFADFLPTVRALIGDGLERVELSLITGTVLKRWSVTDARGNGNGHAPVNDEAHLMERAEGAA